MRVFQVPFPYHWPMGLKNTMHDEVHRDQDAATNGQRPPLLNTISSLILSSPRPSTVSYTLWAPT